jgi:hypothetical protein
VRWPARNHAVCGARRQNFRACPHGDAGKCRGCGYFVACAGGYGGTGRVAAGTGHGHRHGTAVCERGGSEAPRCGIFGADGVVV